MDSYRPVIFLIILTSFHVGRTLRCACKEDLRTCASIQNIQANFRTAQQICKKNGGKLLASSSKTIDSLLSNKTGHFWIDTEGDCLSSRGGSRNSQGDLLTLNRGEDVACSSQCMSVSSDRKLTEHSCEEQIDGFLCDGIQWENCWEGRASEVQILNEEDCLLAPCEHHCKEVPGGYMCTCFSGYRPSSKHPKHCEMYCNSAMCPTLFNKCPAGFVKDFLQCIDIDECKSNHNCMQKCRNTFGSYKCSCHEGFMLVNKSKCVPLIKPTPLTAANVTPHVKSSSLNAGFVTPAVYIVPTLFIILAICGLVYYCRKSKSDALLKDSDIPDNTMVQEA